MLAKIKEKLPVLKKNGRFVVAVSGGPDSMVLLKVMQKLSKDKNFGLAAVHFNHHIRKSSQRDEDIVKKYCAENDIDLYIGSADVVAMGGNLEDAARKARYAYMLSVLNKNDFLVTGHHRSDVAESVLINIMRGAGTRGIAGIAHMQGQVVRPMLEVTQTEIEEYARQHNISYGIDETNMDTGYTRNSVRHELIPFMKKYNPQIENALARAARNANEDEEFLHSTAMECAKGTYKIYGDFFVSIDAAKINKMHTAIKKRGLRSLFERLGVYDVSEDMFIMAINALFDDKLKDIGQGIFIKGGTQAQIYKNPSQNLNIDFKGSGVHKCKHWMLELCVVDKPKNFGSAHDWTQYINIRYIDSLLRARHRKDGDTIALFGGGTKNLADMMTDRKVPLPLRNALPVITCGKDVLWAVGTGISAHAKIEDEDKAIKIKFSWLADNSGLGEF